MGLLIRSLLIVMIMKSIAARQSASSSSQATGSCDQEVEKLKTMLIDYLELVNAEVRYTQQQIEKLKDSMTETQEAVSTELEATRGKVDELQVATSDNREKITSELEETRSKMEELEVSVSALVKLITNDTSEPDDSDATDEFATTTEGDVFPRDCSDILAIGASVSGVYMVRPLRSSQAFQVYCDMETDGGGWTVFQRRQDGSVDFSLDYASYSRGFGNVDGEFWLGNDNLHLLTAQGEYQLRVDLQGFDQVTGYAKYDSFTVADASENYMLRVEGYTGNASNGLKSHNYMGFTTKDKDNDVNALGNCAHEYPGGWWFRFCLASNLNGLYFHHADLSSRGVTWNAFANYRSLKFSEMKIRSRV
ncbi:fibrinogen-like protein A [Asterias amurensis]|uniref:fibrinogen-like protein A n=1 Tax=Asterias amurensis TaxID=7602 RepID=UPI003AB4CFA0